MRPYGSVGKIDSLDTDITFMVIGPDTAGTYRTTYKRILHVVILKGTARYMGALKGPGEIGPVSELGTEVEWLDE